MLPSSYIVSSSKNTGSFLYCFLACKVESFLPKCLGGYFEGPDQEVLYNKDFETENLPEGLDKEIKKPTTERTKTKLRTKANTKKLSMHYS